MPLAAPPLEAHWLAAARAPSAARAAETLRTRDGSIRVPADADARVRRELSVAGRYRLVPSAVVRRPAWWQILTQWIRDRWDAFWNALRDTVHIGAKGQMFVGDLLVVLFVLIIGVLAARMLAAFQFQRNDARVALSELEPQRSAHALFMRASAAAERGDYGVAVRLLFAAAVTLLDLRGVVRDDASATVNELQRELSERGSQIRAPFVEIADAYTAVAYAENPVDRAAWTHVCRAYEALARSAVTP
jgi:hypothetical protein